MTDVTATGPTAPHLTAPDIAGPDISSPDQPRPDLPDADLNAPGLRDRAVAAARGTTPFDLLLTGGRLVDVATGEIRAADIGITGPLVASVHAPGTRNDAAEVVALDGAIVTPGLIDTHMHVESSMVTPRRYAETVVPQGTTTVCWDPHEVGNVAGLDGVRWAIDAARDLPLRLLALAPSCVPSAPGLEIAGAEVNGPEMAQMLGWPDIHGVAEVMDMRGVLDRSERMRDIVGAGLTSGKLVCGHARGLSGADLQAFAAAGIGSDHEITDGDDLLAKLRAGLTIELRGSHDHVLPGAVATLNGLPRFPSTVTICTDDVFPDDLVDRGGMADVLRRLVGYGLDPVAAVQAATLNAAHRLGREDLGRVAPGRRADIAVFADLEGFACRLTVASGRVVARGGRIATPVGTDAGTAFADTMRLAPVGGEAFTLASDAAAVTLNTVKRPRFTEWSTLAARVEDGVVILPEGALMMAVLHRHGRGGGIGLGVLEGWGDWTGAIATTVSHDSHNLTVFGRDPADMAAAANALIGCGGGMAVARGGRVTALLPLPVCGLLSDAPAPQVAQTLRDLRRAAAEVAPWQPPVMTFKSLVGASLACNPGPHVTDLGIADGLTGEVRPPIVAA
ncbi:adenine deaminase [Mesobaculum littorinae]|uniref:Adenine deaminase n=1 Tax=Mesobaculum littorinae TaxID=2486419 RepID=A0A438AGG4_9RHOB|nr:adenine deaminase C-terminal domain-containing protein [Mesobaculum littorinae]RVV97705.1 adenine deaminase [Mesobaculum littorinae]